MTDPTLGIAFDSSGLDQANQKLDQTVGAAKRVEDQAKKTGDSLGKIGASGGEGLKKTAAYADELARSLVKLASDSKQTFNATQAIETVAKNTGVSYAQAAASVKAAAEAHKQLVPVITGSNSALVAHAAATNNAAAAHVGFSTQSMAAVHAVRSLTEQVLAGNFSMQSLAQQFSHLSYAATGPGGLVGALGSVARMIGPTGFAVGGGVAITALSYALEKLGDEIARSEKLFEGLTGTSSSGKIALESAKEAARGAGFELSTMAGGLQKAILGQTEFASKTIIYANSADKAAKDAAHMSEAFGTLGKIMQQVGSTGKEETVIFDLIGSSIQKTGGVTKEAFDKIVDVSPIVALRIAQAFGSKTIDEFEKKLANTPLALDDMLRVLAQIKPAVDAIKWDPTIEQQVRQLSSSWHKLVEEFGNAGGFTAAKSILDTIGGALKQDGEDIKGVASALAYLGDKAASALALLAKLNPANLGAKLHDALTSSSPDPSLSNSDPLGTAPQFAFPDSPSPFAGSTPSPPGSEGFDESGFEGAFASGGSFVVGGSGGTDSQTVTFKATPGEVVTIATPDQAASGIASLTAVSGTTDIEDLLKEQTKDIVAAINGLKSANPNAASAIASAVGIGGGGVPVFGAGSSTAIGTGSAGSATPFAALEAEQRKQEQAILTRERELSGAGPSGGGGGGGFGGFSGVAGGQAVPIRGYDSKSLTPSAPLGPFQTASGVSMNPGGGGGSQDELDARGWIYSQDFGRINNSTDYQKLLNDSVDRLKEDWASQRSFNETIASQNPGGMQRIRPGEVSSSYPPPVSGHYDENMSFIPDNPKNVGFGMMPKSNDYTFAGKMNPAGPYQPGISAPISFPGYLKDVMQSFARKGFDETGFKDAFGNVEKNTGKTNNTLNEAKQILNSLDDTAGKTTDEVESGARDTVSAVDKSSSTIANAIKDALSTMGQSLIDQGNSGGFPGGGGGGGGGGQSGFDTSSSGFGSPGGGGGGGSSFDESGFGPADSGGGFDSSLGGSSGFDESGFEGTFGSSSGSLDFGGSSGGSDSSGSSPFDESGFEGAFAAGGSFTVGGNGGTDTTPVRFWATRGETVSITPRGMAMPPSGIHVPASMLTPSSDSGGTAPQASDQPDRNVTVNFHLQSAAQAEDFIRSRASVVRSLRAAIGP